MAANLIDVKRANGTQVFADSGAVNTTDGRRPVKECAACHGKVVFVQNSAGKWYLANVYMYGSNSPMASFYYLKNRPHYKGCEARQRENERLLPMARGQ